MLLTRNTVIAKRADYDFLISFLVSFSLHFFATIFYVIIFMFSFCMGGVFSMPPFPNFFMSYIFMSWFFVNFVVNIFLCCHFSSIFLNYFFILLFLLSFLPLVSSLKRDPLVSSTQQPNTHLGTKLLARADSVVACAKQSASSPALACCFSASLLGYLSFPFPHHPV